MEDKRQDQNPDSVAGEIVDDESEQLQFPPGLTPEIENRLDEFCRILREDTGIKGEDGKSLVEALQQASPSSRQRLEQLMTEK